MKLGSFSISKLILVIVFLLAIPNLHAQGNKVQVAAAAPAADLVTPDINVIKLSDLNFGTFSSPSVGDGVVTIGTDGTYDTFNTSGVVIFPGTTSAAVFEITGTKNNKLINMTVTSTDLGGLPLTLTYILDPLPIDNLRKGDVTYLKIGGVLDIPAGTPGGTYTGTINVTFINN